MNNKLREAGQRQDHHKISQKYNNKLVIFPPTSVMQRLDVLFPSPVQKKVDSILAINSPPQKFINEDKTLEIKLPNMSLPSSISEADKRKNFQQLLQTLSRPNSISHNHHLSDLPPFFDKFKQESTPQKRVEKQDYVIGVELEFSGYPRVKTGSYEQLVMATYIIGKSLVHNIQWHWGASEVEKARYNVLTAIKKLDNACQGDFFSQVSSAPAKIYNYIVRDMSYKESCQAAAQKAVTELSQFSNTFSENMFHNILHYAIDKLPLDASSLTEEKAFKHVCFHYQHDIQHLKNRFDFSLEQQDKGGLITIANEFQKIAPTLFFSDYASIRASLMCDKLSDAKSSFDKMSKRFEILKRNTQEWQQKKQIEHQTKLKQVFYYNDDARDKIQQQIAEERAQFTTEQDEIYQTAYIMDDARCLLLLEDIKNTRDIIAQNKLANTFRDIAQLRGFYSYKARFELQQNNISVAINDFKKLYHQNPTHDLAFIIGDLIIYDQQNSENAKLQVNQDAVDWYKKV